MLGRVAMIFGVLGTILVCPWIGPELGGEQADFVFWQLRVPRVIMAALVGMVLGTCGAAYQTIFSNPLATPSTVGTTAGAALGALVAEPLYILADTAVVGNLGTPQLAGLALASSLLLIAFAVFIFLAYGTTSAVARLLGAGEHRQAARQAVQSLFYRANQGA